MSQKYEAYNNNQQAQQAYLSNNVKINNNTPIELHNSQQIDLANHEVTPIIQHQQQKQYNVYDGLRRRSSVLRHSVKQSPSSSPMRLMAQQPRRASDEVARMVANSRLSAGPPITNRRSKSVINVNNNSILTPHQVLELQLKQKQQQQMNDQSAENESPMIHVTQQQQQQANINAESQRLNLRRNVLSATRRQSSVDQNRALSTSSSSGGSSVQAGSSFGMRRRSSVIGQGNQSSQIQQSDLIDSNKPTASLIRAPLAPNVVHSNISQQDQAVASPILPDSLQPRSSTSAAVSDKLTTRTPIESPKLSSPQAYLAATPSTPTAEVGVINARKRAASSTQLIRKDSLAKITLKKLTRNMSFSKPADSDHPTQSLSNDINKSTRRKSSSSSATSETLSKHEDKAVTKRILARDCKLLCQN